MKPPKPIELGRFLARPLGEPDTDGRHLWRLEWYPAGGKGQMRTKGLGRRTRDEAELRAHVVIPGIDAPTPVPTAAAGTTWGWLLQRWVAARRADSAAGLLRPRSLLAYDAASRRVRSRMEALPLPSTAAALVLQMETFRDAALQTSAPHTVHLDLAACSGAWLWAVRRDLVPPLPWPSTPIALPEGRGYIPTPEDAARIVARLESRTRAAHRWPAVAVALWYAVAPRIGELAHLRVGDLDLKAGTVRLGADPRASKTGVRVVPLPVELVPRLTAYLAELGRGDDASLWPGSVQTIAGGGLVRKHIGPAAKALGIRRFVMHAARTALADDLAVHGVDARTAADVLGHSPEMQLKRYRRGLMETARSAMDSRTKGNVISIRRHKA